MGELIGYRAGQKPDENEGPPRRSHPHVPQAPPQFRVPARSLRRSCTHYSVETQSGHLADIWKKFDREPPFLPRGLLDMRELPPKRADSSQERIGGRRWRLLVIQTS